MKTAGALMALAVIAVGIWIATHNSGYAASSKGCVNVLVAGATGGQVIHECGAAARSFCKTEFASHDVLARKAQPQCRDAGIYPTGRTSKSP